MKNKITTKQFLISVGLLLAAVMPSCSDFDELNNNPNQVLYGESSPTKLLQETIYQGHWAVLYRSHRINSQLMQYAVYISGAELVSNYNIAIGHPQALWNQLYQWSSNANHIVNLARERNDPNCEAIGLTLKVYLAESITAIFGDIPYDEAYSFPGGISQPVYNPQESVYRQMLAELERANGLYNTSLTLDFPERDLLYNGNISKWKKFTNSLSLRLLMRISRCQMIDFDPLDRMWTILSDPATYPVFGSNSDAAILYYTGENPFYNGFGPTTSTDALSSSNRMCATLMDKMTVNSDPRLPYYAKSNNGEYIGLLSGQTNDYVDANVPLTCNYAASLSTDTTPSIMMSYSEVEFIKAEIFARELLVGDAKASYDAAVTASVRYWMQNESYQLGAFLESPAVAGYDGTLERILDQKYIAMFLTGYEAWNDYRRTGLPVMPVGPAMTNKDVYGSVVLPTRLIYPNTTVTTNPVNSKEAIRRMETGTNDMISRVWWATGTRY